VPLLAELETSFRVKEEADRAGAASATETVTVNEWRGVNSAEVVAPGGVAARDRRGRQKHADVAMPDEAAPPVPRTNSPRSKTTSTT
jgi:hypothetical protein